MHLKCTSVAMYFVKLVLCPAGQYLMSISNINTSQGNGLFLLVVGIDRALSSMQRKILVHFLTWN